MIVERKERGGSLDFNGNGVAGCCICGWRGVPTFIDGIAQVTCPAHAHEPDPDFSRQRAPSRNAPCPCGSGVKAKRCDCSGWYV